MRLHRLSIAMVFSTIALPSVARSTACAQTSLLSAPIVSARLGLERRLAARRADVGVAWSTDTLAVLRHGSLGTTPVPVWSIERERTPSDRDRWRGARRGALVGGVLGAALVIAAVHSDMTCDECFIPASVIAVPAAAVLTLAGAGIGALFAPLHGAR